MWILRSAPPVVHKTKNQQWDLAKGTGTKAERKTPSTFRPRAGGPRLVTMIRRWPAKSQSAMDVAKIRVQKIIRQGLAAALQVTTAEI